MPHWRDHILQHFRDPIHRLTLVTDPDGLMLKEGLLAAVRRNGFDLLPFEDPIVFRYAYESNYRQHWDEGQDTDLVVILRSPGASLRALPYDLLQSSRTLTFSLPDLFPRLSYPVVADLDLFYLQSAIRERGGGNRSAAQVDHRAAARLGQRAGKRRTPAR